MGASESNSSSIDYSKGNFPKQIEENLQFVQQADNVRYGEAKIVQNMETRKQYAIKTFIYSNKNEFKEAFQKATNKQQLLQIPSIVNIVDIKTEVNEHFCSNYYKLVIIYEYYNDTLEKLIQMNKKQNAPFNEQDIYYLVDCVLSALMCMHYNNYNHCDIRPKTIVVTPDGSYKITDLNYIYNQQPTPFKQTILGAGAYHKMYLAPEKLHAIKQRDLPKLQEYLDEWQKGDVYSLGLVALEMATLSDIDQEVINFENFEINRNKIDELLEIVKTRYSYNLYKLIQQMLEYKYTERYDFYKLAEILTPQSQQDSILSLQNAQLQQNQVRQFMLSESKSGTPQVCSPIVTHFQAKREKNSDSKNSHLDELSLHQSTIAAETSDATRADISQMMQNNENLGVFNRYKLKQPFLDQDRNTDRKQNQVRFQDYQTTTMNSQSKSPRLYNQSNNINRYYKDNTLEQYPYEPSLHKIRSNSIERGSYRNQVNKENNVISYKIERQSNLLAQLQTLDLKVHDIIEQSQSIKNQFEYKKKEDSNKYLDVDEREIYDGIERKKQSIRNFKMEKDSYLSYQNSQKSLHQLLEQPSYVSLNNYAAQSNKLNQTPRSQNSSYLNLPESYRSRRDEASPYSSKYLNQRSKSPLNSNTYEKHPQYSENQKQIQKKSLSRNYQDYSSEGLYTNMLKNNYIDQKQYSSRGFSKQNADQDKQQNQVNNRTISNNIQLQEQQESRKSRNQSPRIYSKNSFTPSNNTSYISKNINENSTLSNQMNNKSNITLYELYLKDYENMTKKTNENINTETY